MSIRIHMPVATLGALLVLGMAAPARGVEIGTFPIPLMVESPDKGVFIELTQEIAKTAGISAHISVNPPKRTVEMFSRKELDCFFPALDVMLPGKAAKSRNIYVKQDFAFYQKGKPLVSLADLKGKNVGITLGYPYVKEVSENKAFTLAPANDDVTNMKKLGMGRIDAFVVEEKSGLKALKDSGQGNIEYDPKTPLSKQDVYYACTDTPEGKALAEKISGALGQLQSNGRFGEIMSKAK